MPDEFIIDVEQLDIGQATEQLFCPTILPVPSITEFLRGRCTEISREQSFHGTLVSVRVIDDPERFEVIHDGSQLACRVDMPPPLERVAPAFGPSLEM